MHNEESGGQKGGFTHVLKTHGWRHNVVIVEDGVTATRRAMNGGVWWPKWWVKLVVVVVGAVGFGGHGYEGRKGKRKGGGGKERRLERAI